MDKICFKIISVSIVLTMCNIEPLLSEINISDWIKHVIMLGEDEERKDEELRKLTYILESNDLTKEQQQQLITLIREIPLSYTYTKVKVQTLAGHQYENTEMAAMSMPDSRRENAQQNGRPEEKVLLKTISPRADPCV